MNRTSRSTIDEREVRIPLGRAALEGSLALPPEARGIVVFAHGSGSSRHSSRNRFVAGELQQHGLATFLMDLLTLAEEADDRHSGHLRFDIPLLAERLSLATDWLAQQDETGALRVGYFGASTGGGAALVAAAARPRSVFAVVSRGGRPDLAAETLPHVRAPTLLIVGSRDEPVIELNESARRQLRCEVRMEIVQGASHLFEEPGTLERVAELAADWFNTHLGGGER